MKFRPSSRAIKNSILSLCFSLSLSLSLAVSLRWIKIAPERSRRARIPLKTGPRVKFPSRSCVCRQKNCSRLFRAFQRVTKCTRGKRDSMLIRKSFNKLFAPAVALFRESASSRLVGFFRKGGSELEYWKVQAMSRRRENLSEVFGNRWRIYRWHRRVSD